MAEAPRAMAEAPQAERGKQVESGPSQWPRSPSLAA
jgi:hypothetical protein